MRTATLFSPQIMLPSSVATPRTQARAATAATLSPARSAIPRLSSTKFIFRLCRPELRGNVRNHSSGEEPAKSLYIAGGVNGWDPANPLEFTLGEDGKYTYELAQTGTDGFKISTAKGTWDEFNAGVLGVNERRLPPRQHLHPCPGKDKNITVPTGNYTLTVDLEALTLDIQGEATFTAPDLYLLGDFNEWTASDAYIR